MKKKMKNLPRYFWTSTNFITAYCIVCGAHKKIVASFQNKKTHFNLTLRQRNLELSFFLKNKYLLKEYYNKKITAFDVFERVAVLCHSLKKNFKRWQYYATAL